MRDSHSVIVCRANVVQDKGYDVASVSSDGPLARNAQGVPLLELADADVVVLVLPGHEAAAREAALQLTRDSVSGCRVIAARKTQHQYMSPQLHGALPPGT